MTTTHSVPRTVLFSVFEVCESMKGLHMPSVIQSTHMNMHTHTHTHSHTHTNTDTHRMSWHTKKTET